jgi:hypothetical protein
MNTLHNFPTYFPKIHSNIVFPSTPRSSLWSCSFMFSNQNFVSFSHISNSCYMPCPYHPPCYDHDINNMWSLQVMKIIVQSPPASRHFLPLRTTCFPQHLFSHTLKLCPSLSMRDQVSHPYEITGKIIILCILISKFLEKKQEDRRTWT